MHWTIVSPSHVWRENNGLYDKTIDVYYVSLHTYGGRIMVCIDVYRCPITMGILKKNKKKLVHSFNFTFRFINNNLSLNNAKFGNYVYHNYPIEL